MKFLTTNETINLLKQGEIVAIPTETVYGLAADARDDDAVAKIFEAKGRPSDNPLIVHIGDVAQVDELAPAVTKETRILMDTFWPGPLTVILPSAGTVSNLVSAGLPTVGIRIPAHPLTLSLLKESGIPLAAPSANLSGKPSPTKASHVAADLAGKVKGILDGGICDIGLESTVIDMTTAIPTILRPGGISKEEIESVIGPVLVADGSTEKPKAPGMKYAHYAPKAKVHIVDGSYRFLRKTFERYLILGIRVGVLSDKLIPSKYSYPHLTIKRLENGKNLYNAFREFDDEGVHVILCEYQCDEAIMNRLMKASEERVLREVEN